MKRIFVLCLCLGLMLSAVPVMSVSADSNSTNETVNVITIGDTHYGDTKDDFGPANREMKQWVTNQSPEYIFHMGDVTEDSQHHSWQMARDNFSDITNQTPTEKIWFTTGASHDGFTDKVNSHTEDPKDLGMNQLKKMQMFNHTSMLYSVEFGNNVFITVPTYSRKINSDQSQFFAKAWRDWLRHELEYYDEHDYNIIFYTHQPLNNTNAYTDPSDSWYGMDDAEWQENSRTMKGMVEKYDVDVVLTGHVHSDPDKHKPASDAKSGKVVNGSNFSDLPNTTFISNAATAWKHGSATGDGKSNYPSVNHWNFTENKSYITIRAYDLHEDSEIPIAYGDNGNSNAGIRIGLDHPIELDENSNGNGHLDDYHQGWMPTDIPDIGNNSREDFFVQDEGFKVKKDAYWWNSTWQWPNKQVVPADVTVNKSGGELEHRFYSSNNNRRYDSYQVGSRPVDWFKVNSSVHSFSGDEFYVYHYNLTYALVFEEANAELRDGVYVVKETSDSTEVKVNPVADDPNISRNTSVRYSLKAQTNATIGDIVVGTDDSQVNLTPNQMRTDEISNFSANSTAGNVTFKLTGLNDSKMYTVYRDGEVYNKNITPTDGELAFHNDQWSTHQFVVEEGGTPLEEIDDSNGILPGDECDSLICLSQEFLHSVLIGVSIGLLSISALFYRRFGSRL